MPKFKPYDEPDEFEDDEDSEEKKQRGEPAKPLGVPHDPVAEARRCQNLNPDHYREAYRQFAERIRSAHGELQGILGEKTNPQRTFSSKQKEAQYFRHRIEGVKRRLARLWDEEERLWLFIHEDPLRIPGALFNPKLANDLVRYRSDLAKLFIDFGRNRMRFESSLTDAEQLATVCEAMALSKETPVVTRTGLLAPTRELVELVSGKKFSKKNNKK